MEPTRATAPASEVDDTTRRLGGTAAGVLMIVSGSLVVVDALLHPHHEVAVLATVGGVSVVGGAVVLRLPWQRWPTRALLWIIPPVLVLIGIFNHAHQNVYLGCVFLIIVAMGLGLAQPRGTALALSPVLGGVYWASMALGPRAPGFGESVPYVTLACAMVGETVAWQTARLGQTQGLLRARGERRFQALLAGGSDTTVVLDAAGVVEFASPSAGRVLRIEAELLEGLQLHALAERYIHPDDRAGFIARIQRLTRTAADHEVVQFRLRQPDGSWIDIEGLGRNLLSDQDVHGVLLNLRDVSERKRLEQALAHQAFHDQLTGLPNRVLLHDRIDQAIRQVDRELVPAALLLLDLDHFRQVNDTLGHHNGDRLLVSVSQRLQATLREVDTVARLGGDEFGVLLPRSPAAEHAMAVAGKLRAALAEPFTLDSVTFDVEASIGVALYPDHGNDADELLQHADIAMYAAKETHAGFVLFDPTLDQHSPRKLALLGQLRRAIEEEQLVLHYQPKVDAQNGRVLGVEALVRWQRPDHGPISPGEFIPLAERTGLMAPLTHYVLDAALHQCQRWRRAGIELSVAVNISARRLLDLGFPDEVADLLAVWQVPPPSLVLELTESAIMADPDRALEILGRLNQMGVQLSIDDFGTGYSSMAYLKRLPVDELKVDQSFVSHLTTDNRDALIVRSTVDLGRNLGLRVVAEGVEDEATQRELAVLGCNAIQGYHISRPMAADDLTIWLTNWQATAHDLGR
jgi:diguanylate cyclase (GGDEF)-like protein/PAS domain S-box-containing protein